MDQNKKITIFNDCGEEEQVELVTELESAEGVHYLVYTKNEMDDQENVLVYTSKIVEEDGRSTLVDLTDQEWEEIQEFLNETIEEED